MKIIEIIVTILLVGGLIFFTGGTVGIIRFPDFYSRLHPAGKLDTSGLLLTMSAMALYTLNDFSLGSVLTSIKIMVIVAFVFITSPTATHAIIDAGFIAGLRPWTKSTHDPGVEEHEIKETKSETNKAGNPGPMSPMEPATKTGD
jgi:multicomponent Na+:H+ antiporter subunit G